MSTDVHTAAPLTAQELRQLGARQMPHEAQKKQRAVFCSRSLDLSKTKVVGYDMDYTLVNYFESVWEARAYFHAKQVLREKGFPVDDLEFESDLVCRGLVVRKSRASHAGATLARAPFSSHSHPRGTQIDQELGNLIKVDRFGYVRRAMHGQMRLSTAAVQEIYGRTVVDLREDRYSFLNTLFSCSEGCLYAQLVEKLDDGRLARDASEPFDADRVNDYRKLFHAVSKALFRAHVGGELKKEVMADPARFVRLDEDLAQTLLDQRDAGKALVLITNSDWTYTNAMLSYIIDRSERLERAQRRPKPARG